MRTTRQFRVQVCLAIGALGILLSALSIYGQSQSPADTATLSGYVRDSNGHAIAGVTVDLLTSDTTVVKLLRTGADGAFRFSGLAAGTYVLRAVMAGFADGTSGPFELKATDNRNIDLALKAAPAAQAASTTGSAGAPQFFDEPKFTVAGVTDTANSGGHGSNTAMRTTESLAKDTLSLSAKAADASQPASSETEKTLRDKVNHDPANAEFHHALGEIEEKLGNPVQAVGEYQRAAELQPSETNLFDWGTELLLHGAGEPAVEVFTKGARMFPRSARMRVGLGVAWYALGGRDQAVQYLFEASDLNPEDASPYLFLGKMQSADALQSPGLVQRLARFARLHPQNALANYYYALALWNRGKASGASKDLDQVVSLLETAVILDPKLSAGFLQLGILYGDREDLPKAIAEYRRAIAADPLSAEAHYRLGQAYGRAGEKQNAEKELQLYEKIAKQNTEDAAREQHEIQQFVYTLQGRAAADPTRH